MTSKADPVEIDGNAHAPRRDDVSAAWPAREHSGAIKRSLEKAWHPGSGACLHCKGDDHPPRCWPGDRSRRRGTGGTSSKGKVGRTGLNAGSPTRASGDLLH